MRYIGTPHTVHMEQTACPCELEAVRERWSPIGRSVICYCRDKQRTKYSLTIGCTDGHRRKFSLSEESARLVMLGNVVPALVEIEAEGSEVSLMVVHRQLGGST